MSLWGSSDPKRWATQLQGYWDAVASASNGKKSRLAELDRWYFEALPPAVAARDPPYLTKEELIQLVDWKLTRGKTRPRLLQYAKDSNEMAVKDATLKGLSLLAAHKGGEAPASVVQEALAAVTALKGVGPATGSAILSALDPSVGFMSDEALETALGNRDYTVPQFKKLLEALRGKAQELSAADAGGQSWTARDVERCLFAAAATGVRPAAASDTHAPPSKKRKKR